MVFTIGIQMVFSQYETNPVIGDWETAGNWVGNNVPNYPVADWGDQIDIYGRITRNGNLTIRTFLFPTGQLNIYDTLIVDGDLEIDAASELNIFTRGVLLVLGDLTIDGFFFWGGEGANEGDIVVLGDLNVDPPSDFDTQNGDTYVGGNVDDPGGGITGTVGDENDLENDNPDLFDFVNDVACNISISGSVTDVTCNGGGDGAIDITVTGTTAPNYSWDSGETSEDITGKSAGTYNITVTEAICVASQDFTIYEPAAVGSAIAADQDFCDNATVADLSATPGANGDIVDWYAAATGGTALLTTNALIDGNQYYAETRNSNSGCVSSLRTEITVNIYLTPLITNPGDQNVCDGYTLPLIGGSNLSGN